MFSFSKPNNGLQSEDRVQKLNILLKAISRVNQLIVKEKNHTVIFQNMCDYLVSTGLFSLVGVALKVEGSFDVRLVAKAGKSISYFDQVKITWDETPTGMGPARMAIKTRLPQIIQDLTANTKFKTWLEQAKLHDLKSAMVLPLIVNGEVIGVIGVYSPTVNAFGVDEINLLVEISEDIGFGLQSIENEEKLRQSEKRYRALAEAAHDLIYVIDKDFKVEFVNSFTAKHFKQDAVSLVGKPYIDFFSSEAAERHKKNLEKVLVTGEPLYMESEEDLGDKKSFLGSWLCPIFDDKGKPTSVLGISRDISARKLIEIQLQQSEQNYKNLVDLSPDSLFVHGGGKILFVNQTALKMLGADDPKKIIGQPVMNFVHVDSKELVKKRIEDMASGVVAGVPFVEEKFIRLDGTYIDVEVGSVAIIFQGQKAFQVIARDLSARKAMELEKEKYFKEVEKLNEFMVGRELKMKELKKENEALKKKCV